MKSLIIISIYFLILILIIRLSKIMAQFLVNKGKDLNEIKFIVWFYLNSFIINLTIIAGGLLAYQINLIPLSAALILIILFFILLIISIIFLAYKLFFN